MRRPIRRQELGWHVLRNQSHQETKDASGAVRDVIERDFFSQGIWRSIDSSSVGVAALRRRLSAVLWKQILRHLPRLREDGEARILESEDILEKLGETRGTMAHQRRYLLNVSQKFCTLMTAAVDGNYSDAFFGDVNSEEGYAKRIRAVVQCTLRDFGETMLREGKSECIMDNDVEGFNGKSRPGYPTLTTRSEYLERVIRLMRRSKGRELPGTFNPIIVQDLFQEQCRPWKVITAKTTDSVVGAVTSTAMSILDHVALAKTVSGISAIVNEGIRKLVVQLNDKVTELMAPHYDGHPITYNHYLTDIVQKAQAQRRLAEVEKLVQSEPTMEAYKGKQLRHQSAFSYVQVSDLLFRLGKVEFDMEKQASGLAMDYSEAYYKARKYSSQHSR